ncbi:MAG: phytoene/squalene synthase family protein [Phycisphaerales bacterium]
MSPAPTTSTGSIRPAHAGADGPTLERSFEACRQITRAAARNFFYGLRLTPEPRRSAIFALYAWMRQGDDLADSGADIAGREARLAEFRARTEQALSGSIPSTTDEAFWPAFCATIESYPIDRDCLRAMLRGLASDLAHCGFASFEDLDGYCFDVGSTVGVTCMNVWGLRPTADAAAARERAIARGRAFQLTNILRDVAADFDDTPSRIYLPRALFAAHGLSPAELRTWSRPGPCADLILDAAARAERYYEASRGLEGDIAPDCAPALWGMTSIYRGILRLVLSDPARVVGTQRVRLSAARKGLIAISAVVRQRAGAWALGGA